MAFSVCNLRQRWQVSEHLANAPNARHKGVDLLSRVVKGKRSAHRTQHSQAIHQRLRAVVTRANSNAQLVEQSAHIHVVDVAHVEADDGIANGIIRMA